jgi:hypothetical protein
MAHPVALPPIAPIPKRDFFISPSSAGSHSGAAGPVVCTGKGFLVTLCAVLMVIYMYGAGASMMLYNIMESTIGVSLETVLLHVAKGVKA